MSKKNKHFVYLYKNYILIINNKIEKTLTGPSIFIGIAFLILGAGFIFNNEWFLGLFFLLLASFLFFTYSGIEIDTTTKQIKSYYIFLGLIKHGKWQSLEKYRGVTLVPMKKVTKTFSRSNRQNSTTKKYFEIYLVNEAKKPALPIKRCDSLEHAQNSLDEFSIWLKMPVFSVKK